MMDRHAAAQINGAHLRREAEITRLVGEAKAARAKVQEQEVLISQLQESLKVTTELNLRLAGKIQRAVTWAVRLESELARYEYRDREYRVDHS
jgi:hypothetical protein